MPKPPINCNLLALALCILWGCQSEANIQEASVERTLDTYIRGVINSADSSLILDSLIILRIDSISSKELMLQNLGSLIDTVKNLTDALKLDVEIYDVEAERYQLLSSISDNREALKVLKERLVRDGEKIDRSLADIKLLKSELDSINAVYESGTIDSTDFLFLRPYYRICISNKLLEQRCSDGNKVLITKDFRVQKN